jgi:hypothetical protein
MQFSCVDVAKFLSFLWKIMKIFIIKFTENIAMKNYFQNSFLMNCARGLPLNLLLNRVLLCALTLTLALSSIFIYCGFDCKLCHTAWLLFCWSSRRCSFLFLLNKNKLKTKLTFAQLSHDLDKFIDGNCFVYA